MRVANEIVMEKIIEFLREQEEVSRLRSRVMELERELEEQREIVRSLKSPPNILTDVELQRFTGHDQIVYKLGLALMALDFKSIQVDLSSTWTRLLSR
jgi:CII-binding regulator of phage lambda lysogenization HflD